ncbi:hypothetical protein FACS189415_7210 [Bacteroidia bacterium]|nr:hypothetical protein FACS189415_7210 [Bacteroidia bacterium]
MWSRCVGVDNGVGGASGKEEQGSGRMILQANKSVVKYSIH